MEQLIDESIKQTLSPQSLSTHVPVNQQPIKKELAPCVLVFAEVLAIAPLIDYRMVE